MPQVNALTGARTRFLIDGVTVALGLAVSVNHSITWEPVKVLDNLKTLGHEPTDYNASLTASAIRTVTETATALGLFPRRGATPEEFLLNVLTQRELVAQFEDRRSPNTIVGQLTGVLLTSENFSIDRQAGITTSALEFVAIDFKDQAELS